LSRVGPEVAVGAVVIAELEDAVDATRRTRHVLLVKRAHPPLEGAWTLPGGRVHRGERLEAALLREVMEETSLAITIGPLVEVVEIVREDFHYVIMDYLAHFTGDSATLRAGDDAADARWVGLDELGAYGVTPAVQRVIDRACAMARG
jgi:ADP-ribose pyrophosphatase YjhB (NUDIX family)